MTVDELIEKLAAMPGHYEVIVNNSSDYEDYEPVSQVSKGMFVSGFTGGHFRHLEDLAPDEYPDSVLIL